MTQLSNSKRRHRPLSAVATALALAAGMASGFAQAQTQT